MFINENCPDSHRSNSFLTALIISQFVVVVVLLKIDIIYYYFVCKDNIFKTINYKNY